MFKFGKFLKVKWAQKATSEVNSSCKGSKTIGIVHESSSSAWLGECALYQEDGIAILPAQGVYKIVL